MSLSGVPRAILYGVAGTHDDDALDIRVSDAEREETVQELRGHLTAGRLTVDEFGERVSEVYASRTGRDLDHALRQLPRSRPVAVAQGRRQETPEQRERRIRRLRHNLAGFVTPNVACITIWAMTTGGHAYF